MLAAGADAPGVLLDSLGTAEALTMVRDRPLDDSAVGWDGFNQGAFDAGRPLYYVFGGLPTAAASVEWFRGLHGGVDHATLIAEAEAAGGEAGERPVPAASAPGLAALPRPGRARRLSRPLVRDRPRHAVSRRARGDSTRRRQHAQGDAGPSGRRPARADPRHRRQHPQPAPDAPQGLGLRCAFGGHGPGRHDLPGCRPVGRNGCRAVQGHRGGAPRNSGCRCASWSPTRRGARTIASAGRRPTPLPTRHCARCTPGSWTAEAVPVRIRRRWRYCLAEDVPQTG